MKKREGFFSYYEVMSHKRGEPAHPSLYRTKWKNRREYLRSKLADKWQLHLFHTRRLVFPEGTKTFHISKRPWDGLIWKIVGKAHHNLKDDSVRIELTREQGSHDWGYEDMDEADARFHAKKSSS